ncbi:MAG: lipocalin family protein [Povalibacter sp.]
MTLPIMTGCATDPAKALKPVDQVDIPRYMGDWHVIANIPYFAERDCYDSVESYALRSDGRIDNWFTCRRGSADAPFERQANAVATVTNTQNNAEWAVKFFHLISVDYLVLELDADYRWAVIGHPSRKYGWVVARDKRLDESTYQSILQLIDKQGYDSAKFVKVPQQ